MNNIISQLNCYYSGEELLNKLTVLPEYNYAVSTLPERMTALLDIYKIFIPNGTTVDIYNRLYLALLNSLDKKNQLLETALTNDNFRTIKGYKRYGIIGGIESFKITGAAGLGKTSNIHRCADVIAENIILKSDEHIADRRKKHVNGGSYVFISYEIRCSQFCIHLLKYRVQKTLKASVSHALYK